MMGSTAGRNPQIGVRSEAEGSGVPEQDGGPWSRPVDLARLAGVSAQQIRNYEEAGLLPAARRSVAGHRLYTGRHRRALLTYRALLTGYGPPVAYAVQRALLAGDPATALARLDEAHAALHEERLALRTTGRALETLTDQADRGDREEGAQRGAAPGGLRIGEVAARLGVRTSALRVWEEAGLLRPARERGTKYRVYGPGDLWEARVVALLRGGHHPLPVVRTVLDELRRSGGREALREALATREAALTARSAATLDGAAAVRDFLTAEEQSRTDTP